MQKLVREIFAKAIAKRSNLNSEQLLLVDQQLEQSDCSFQELAQMLAPQINANEQDIYDYLLNNKQSLRQFRHRIQHVAKMTELDTQKGSKVKVEFDDKDTLGYYITKYAILVSVPKRSGGAWFAKATIDGKLIEIGKDVDAKDKIWWADVPNTWAKFTKIN